MTDKPRDHRGRFTKAEPTDPWDTTPSADPLTFDHGPHAYDPFPTVDACRTCIQDEDHPMHNPIPAAIPVDWGNVTLNGKPINAEVDITATGANIVIKPTGWLVPKDDPEPLAQSYRWALILALACAVGWAITAYALIQTVTNR